MKFMISIMISNAIGMSSVDWLALLIIDSNWTGDLAYIVPIFIGDIIAVWWFNK